MQHQDKTQEQLAELSIFRSFAEASSEGFSMADLDGRLLYLNPALCRMLDDVRPEDYIGRHLSVFYPEESNRIGREEIEPALLRDGRWKGEIAMLTRSGKIVPTWHSGFVIRDESGNPLRLGVTITDITQRKQAETALRQSRDELQAIYDGTSDGMLIVDVESKCYVKANASICRMLGYSEAEMLSLTVRDIHPAEEVPVAMTNIEKRAAGLLQGHVEIRMLRRDGTILNTDVVGFPLTHGGRPCVLAFFRDITSEKEAQDALERERRTLKHMLQASDHERRLIAYDIHDGLAQELAGAIMQFQVYAHVRQTDPARAGALFDAGMSMLRGSQAEARRLISGVRPPILDESGVVAAIAHLAYDTAASDGPKVDLRNRVAFKRLAPIVENVIYRIVQEALSNARNHSQSDGIRISLVQRGDRLRISVRDWGVGFEPNTIPEGHFGIEGIRERARVLGGWCRIKSRPGKGTAVIVELPVVELRADAASH